MIVPPVFVKKKQFTEKLFINPEWIDPVEN